MLYQSVALSFFLGGGGVGGSLSGSVSLLISLQISLLFMCTSTLTKSLGMSPQTHFHRPLQKHERTGKKYGNVFHLFEKLRYPNER